VPPTDKALTDEPSANQPPVTQRPASGPSVTASPAEAVSPKPAKPAGAEPGDKPHLADTGMGELGGVASLSSALVVGGLLLSRRGRAARN
jgi:hypothetical protein